LPYEAHGVVNYKEINRIICPRIDVVSQASVTVREYAAPKVVATEVRLASKTLSIKYIVAQRALLSAFR
jgi:hypothetical protein